MAEPRAHPRHLADDLVTWRKRSIYVGLATHIAIGSVSVLMLFLLILGGGA